MTSLILGIYTDILTNDILRSAARPFNLQNINMLEIRHFAINLYELDQL